MDGWMDGGRVAMFFLGFVGAMQILLCGECMEELTVYLGDSFQHLTSTVRGMSGNENVLKNTSTEF